MTPTKHQAFYDASYIDVYGNRISACHCLICWARKPINDNDFCDSCLIIIAQNKKQKTGKGKATYGKMKHECIEAYGGQCVCCGCNVEKYLQLDHVYGYGSVHRKRIANDDAHGAAGGASTYAWAKKNNFPPILQLMCANCNQAKNTGGCTAKDHEWFTNKRAI